MPIRRSNAAGTDRKRYAMQLMTDGLATKMSNQGTIKSYYEKIHGEECDGAPRSGLLREME